MNEPTIAQEVEDRAIQREKIAQMFKAHPLVEIEPDELRNITPHYQQRISELKRKHGMNIVNVPRWMVPDGGTRKKRDGAYRYEPHERLGRDAGDQVQREWNQTGPFTEDFRLRG